MSDGKRIARIALLCFAALLLFPAPVLAHKVFLFAWVEDQTVLVDAYFSKSRKVRHGTIRVETADGELLLTGETDDNGAFAFPVPRKTDLHLFLDAGTGHKGAYVLTADELPGVAGEVEAPAASGPAAAAKPAQPQAPAVADPAATAETTAALTRLSGQLAGIDRRLAALERAVAESRREQEPGIPEIVGGIGWILGIMGLFLYARGRRR